jgi:hypothetical protein
MRFVDRRLRASNKSFISLLRHHPEVMEAIEDVREVSEPSLNNGYLFWPHTLFDSREKIKS